MAATEIRHERNVLDVQGRMTEMKTLREENGTPDTTRWFYDEATGLLTNKLYADNKGPAYSYTPDGKLATRTWARGLVTCYNYDGLGQLTNISYSDSTPSISFAYDRMGRQITITDGQGTRTFTYNNALQLASELLIAGGATNQIDRSYDQYGRPTGFDANDDYSVTYGYDPVGRFSAVSNNVGGALRAATYSYLPGSDLLASLSNGPVQIARSYEPNRNLITQMRNTSGSTLISQYDYVNDAAGRRTSVGMSGDAFSELGISHNKYAYNVRSELTQAKQYGGTNLASTANAIDGQAYLYDYDLIGNRTEVYTGDMLNGSKHTYTANSLNQYTQKTVPSKARITGAAATDATVTVNNQASSRYNQYFQSYLDIVNSGAAAYPLISVTGVKKNAGSNNMDVVSTSSGHVFVAQTPEQFSYDDDGNMTQDGRWIYTWDAENRLIGMETLSSLPAAVPRIKLAFAYDYMSRRVGKTVSTNSAGSWTQASDSSFSYDGWNLISELSTANGQLSTNSYVWGLDLSGTLQGAGGIGGLLSSCSSSSNVSHLTFYFFDANGNVGQLVSTNSEILARYEYDPYGNLLSEISNPEIRNPFKFSSKYTDGETGLLYYGYRYYQPEVGRWVSPAEQHSRRLLSQLTSHLIQQPNQQTSISQRYAFANNSALRQDSSVVLRFSDRAFGALADMVIVIPSDDDGHVLCKNCDEKPVISGCDKWEAILQSGCKAHEQKHMDQAPSTWCQWKTVTRKLGNGIGVTESCCPDKGKYLGPDDIGKPRWPDLECPAHAAGIEEMAKQLNGVLSDKDRTTLTERIKDECALMAAKGCNNMPSACGKK